MNYSNLMEAVNARIKANGRREITGDILNDVLRAMVSSLGAGYQMGGTIHPDDKPKVEDQRVAFLAVEPGMYLYAGGFEVTELSLITYGAEWYMYPLGVPFGTQIAEDITAAIEGEKTRAMAAEKKLGDAIATETSERKAADAALDNDIKAEVTRATNAENANARAIVNEASARKSADDALTTKIETEETERKAADATLTKNINTEAFERKNADTALDTRVTAIESKIPAQATAENKLADKDFVNSSIATATATFRGTFETLEALKATTADKNDYAFWVHKDDAGNTCYDKYTYTGTEWLFEYRLNNSSFTAAQWAALNSGVTADVIKALQDADKANAKAIADEKAERVAAIAAEQQARAQADETNANAIATEVSERKAADNALQANIDKKQDIITDLAVIRTQAANGQTAYGWGDHAKAGYVKPFVITLSGDGSAENPYKVDKTREEVATALMANSLILLKGEEADFPGYFEIYTLTWATNYPSQALILQFGNIDEASLIYTTMVLVFSYQEGVGVNVMASSTKLATDEQVKAKQDTLISGTNIKTINGESLLGRGDLKVSGGSPLVITLTTGTGSSNDPYKVDKSVQDVLNAIDAKSLIYLYNPTTTELYPAMYIISDEGNVMVYFAVTWADDNALWAFSLDTNASGELYVERYDFSYVIGSMLATINGQNLLNGGEDIKVGVPTIQAGNGNKAEVFNGNPPVRASGNYSHAEGENTQANGRSSHAEGSNTIAGCPHSHAEGIYNVEDLYAIHSVGIGKSATARKDAHRITYDGKHYIPGIGGFDGTKATEDLNGEKDLATVINEMTPVILNYNGLGGNNEPIFVGEDGTSLTRGQICSLLNGVNANRVVLKNKAAAVSQTCSAKFLQCDGANAFVLGFDGANAAGQIFDILYSWDATAAKVLRAELIYNPTA